MNEALSPPCLDGLMRNVPSFTVVKISKDEIVTKPKKQEIIFISYSFLIRIRLFCDPRWRTRDMQAFQNVLRHCYCEDWTVRDCYIAIENFQNGEVIAFDSRKKDLWKPDGNVWITLNSKVVLDGINGYTWITRNHSPGSIRHGWWWLSWRRKWFGCTNETKTKKKQKLINDNDERLTVVHTKTRRRSNGLRRCLTMCQKLWRWRLLRLWSYMT